MKIQSITLCALLASCSLRSQANKLAAFIEIQSQLVLHYFGPEHQPVFRVDTKVAAMMQTAM